MSNHLNGQYIMEGFTAAFVFMAGAIGFIVLDYGTQLSPAYKWKAMLAGLVVVVVMYNAAVGLLRIKAPYYMRT
jgi:hypothetical protein